MSPRETRWRLHLSPPPPPPSEADMNITIVSVSFQRRCLRRDTSESVCFPLLPGNDPEAEGSEFSSPPPLLLRVSSLPRPRFPAARRRSASQPSLPALPSPTSPPCFACLVVFFGVPPPTRTPIYSPLYPSDPDARPAVWEELLLLQL